MDVLCGGGCVAMESLSIPDCRLVRAAAAVAAAAEARCMEAVGGNGTGATESDPGAFGDVLKLCWLAAASIDARCEAATDAADWRDNCC